MYSARPFSPLQADSAVSPVVATLLIIALTIVIVGIVGVFASGMINTAALTGKIVGVTAEAYAAGDEHGVRMTYWGGKGGEQLESIRAEIAGNQLVTADGEKELTTFTTGGTYDFLLKAVTDEDDLPDGTHVVYTRILNTEALVGVPVNFVGKFKDGSEQVLYMWKLSIPELSVSDGVFYKDDNISVSGYCNTSTMPGRGIAVTALSDAVKSIKITDMNLKDTKGNSYLGTDNLSSDAKKDVSISNGQTIHLSLIAGAPILESPYREGTISDKLTGTVTIDVTYKTGTPKVKTISNLPVTIDARVCIFEDLRYAGKIVSYKEFSGKTDDEFYVMFDRSDNGLISQYHISFFGIETNSGNNKLHSYNAFIDDSYYTNDGHRVYGTFDLKNEESAANVTFYVRVDVGESKSPIWYLVDRKTIAQLTTPTP